jgi:hypothetical protein
MSHLGLQSAGQPGQSAATFFHQNTPRLTGATKGQQGYPHGKAPNDAQGLSGR